MKKRWQKWTLALMVLIVALIVVWIVSGWLWLWNQVKDYPEPFTRGQHAVLILRNRRDIPLVIRAFYLKLVFLSVNRPNVDPYFYLSDTWTGEWYGL